PLPTQHIEVGHESLSWPPKACGGTNMKRAILILLLAQVAMILPTAAQGKDTKITETEAKAVIQAVQDEIYDYGYEKHFFQMGENVGDSPLRWKSRLPIYI